MTSDDRFSITAWIFYQWDMRKAQYYEFQIEKCQQAMERATLRKRSYKRKLKIIEDFYSMEE